MGNVIGWLLAVLGGILALFCAYTMLIYTPVSLYAEAQCLRNGYPKTYVSVGLEMYCSTLDGSVTVTVRKL